MESIFAIQQAVCSGRGKVWLDLPITYFGDEEKIAIKKLKYLAKMNPMERFRLIKRTEEVVAGG